MADAQLPKLTPEEEAQDLGPGMQAACIAIMTIQIVAVALRFLSRWLNKPERGSRFWWDDWTCLIALPIGVATAANVIYQVHLGLGKHLAVIPKENLFRQIKHLWIGYFLYDSALALARCSALLFLTRVFARDHPSRFRHWALAAHIFNVLWFITVIILGTFICNPPQKYWQPWIAGKCINTDRAWLGAGIAGIFADAAILILPMPMLWRLKSTFQRKLLLSFVFLVSYGVIVVTIGRLVVIDQIGERMDTDMTYLIIVPLYWSVIEAPLALVSCCLPSIFLLGRYMYREGYLTLRGSHTKGTESGYQSEKSDSSEQTKKPSISSGNVQLYVDPEQKGIDESRVDTKGDDKNAITSDKSGTYVENNFDVESQSARGLNSK